MTTFFNSLAHMKPRVALRFVKFLLLSVLGLWLIVPGVVSAQVVDIPDANLRAAIAEALNKAPGDAITRADMETLGELPADDRDITDLRGIEFAINLTRLGLQNNNISDISPLSSLTNLTRLYLYYNNISDIVPLMALTKLTYLTLFGNNISDIVPLMALTKLETLGLAANSITDIVPLMALTKLETLNLSGNSITDISPLSSLINLTGLNLASNTITDIVPLIDLTNLTHLSLQHNNISDVETLERLMAQGTVVHFGGNPAFETPGPKIEDGWVWLIVPATGVSWGSDAAESGRDFLSEASGGAVTEADVARNGARVGTQVGNSVWTAAPLNATDEDNLSAILRDYNLGRDIDFPVAYGVVPIRSETQQQTRVYIGGGPVKVWLNGTLVYRDTEVRFVENYATNYATAVPVQLNAGENQLFVAAYRQYRGWTWGAVFGFQDGTVYTVGAPAVVDIPDPNLRAAITEALDKAPGDDITRTEMETLVELSAASKSITDLRGIEFAINLTELRLWNNDISDISPLSNLINLTYLHLWGNNISDISAVASLTKLTYLSLGVNDISDISPLTSLTNLTHLSLHNNTITDISAVANLTKLTYLSLSDNTITDISVVASLTKLTRLFLWGNNISDISPLSNLINLTYLSLSDNTITDISAVANLTNLETLNLWGNNISDISAVASLTKLTRLSLDSNTITDILPLIDLTNLMHLYLRNNNISDVETLERLMAQGTVVYFSGNPAFETPGPKIEDGWVWLIVPATGVDNGSDAVRSGRDFLSEASGGTVTEAYVARNGARAGTRVGDSVWTVARLDATDPNNLNTIAQDYNLGPDIAYPVTHGVVPNPSEAPQEIGDSVWTAARLDATDPDKRNVLMQDYNLEVDFLHPVAYGVVPIHSETQQETRVYIGGAPVKVWVNGTLVHKNTDSRTPDNYETAVPIQLNAGENLLFIAAYRQDSGSQWGAFFGFQDGTGYTVGPGPDPDPEPLDVNGDGQLNVLDLVLVAVFYGTRGNGLPADVNADGIVNVQDFAAVAAGVDAAEGLPQQVVKDILQAAIEQAAEMEPIAAAPVGFGNTPQQVLSSGSVYRNVTAALTDAKHLSVSDGHLVKGVALLESLLDILTEMGDIPEATALLPNYPNPFNPETWIPYQLSEPADVTVTIYAANGQVVRTLAIGHQHAGMYQTRSRAAYWDGRNALSEPVASGLYFYTFTAGEFTATRKLLIRK